jgi:hypothetical protein
MLVKPVLLVIALIFFAFPPMPKVFQKWGCLQRQYDKWKSQLLQYPVQEASIISFCHPYVKYIDVECYIVNREQLENVFNSSDYEVIQLTNNQLLDSSEIYLFVRLRNTGKYGPYGTLDCFVSNVKGPFRIEVERMFKRFENYDYAFRLNHSALAGVYRIV